MTLLCDRCKKNEVEIYSDRGDCCFFFTLFAFVTFQLLCSKFQYSHHWISRSFKLIYLVPYIIFDLSDANITVALYSGRSQREKDRLAEAITEDTVKIMKVEKKDVIVLFQEASHGNWYASGIRL